MKLSSFVTAHLFAIAWGTFFAIMIWAGVSYWNNAKSAQQILVLEETEKLEKEKLENFKSQEQIYSKIQAESLLNSAESGRILWSKVLEDVLKYQNLDLRFESFSSDSQKLISINGWGKSLEVITRLLDNLKKDPKIKAPFYGSINRSTSGQDLGFTFTLSFYYEDLL